LNHEFIHSIDPKSKINSDKEKKKPYMKMLSEFDAFSGEVIEDIHVYVDRKIRYCKKYYEEEDLKNNLSKLKWQIDYALRYLRNPVKYAKIRGIFDEIKADNVLDIYLHDAMKDRIGSIGTNMRKRLITRLYHACNDALNLVEKEIQKLPNYEVDDEELL
jgi:hypothetical protein